MLGGISTSLRVSSFPMSREFRFLATEFVACSKPEAEIIIVKRSIQGRKMWVAGAPRAERGPGASSYITDIRFCELQTEKMPLYDVKKGFHRNPNGFSDPNYVILKKKKKSSSKF